ncbi:uncharacterized protein [Atheta coriaria]|uniref:uncharacterized protein n=1 Tax=Dalotia coriaria TaxID=877792 RepID=UPI0031F44CFB
MERIPASTLVGNSTKRLPVPQTRLECEENCLAESDFRCRSTKFRLMPVNSVINDYYAPRQTADAIGECTLSSADRFITPQGFRVSGYDDEYFENQCADPVTNEFCAFEEYPNVMLTHVDAVYPNLTNVQCQRECEQYTAFRCRGYSLIPSFKASMSHQQYMCLVHSENSKVHGPKSLREHPGAMYYERAPCLNIRVECTNTLMTISYDTDMVFNGKIYMKGFSETSECYVIGNKSRHVELHVPLTSHKCGITKITSDQNRTLYASTMVLQYNSMVQTQADRIIKVGCIFGSGGNRVVVGTGFNITDNTDHTGSTNINSTLPNQPTVEMKIIDLSSNEVGDTEIGDELQLIIEMKPANSGIDLTAGHLIAMTETSQDSILLLDDRGCPTNLDAFPGLKKQVDGDSIKLTSSFQAFKFSSSNVIRFSVTVTFCEQKCPDVDCGGETFYNRMRRRADLGDNEVAVKSVNRSEFQRTDAANHLQGNKTFQMALEYTLIVRNINAKPDKLVYGENNKILVAGFDYLNNEVCIDFSLVIGLIVLWLLIQIILLVACFMLIRKYKKHYENQYLNESIEELHKNFGLGFSNLDTSRRVRFDDTNVMT